MARRQVEEVKCDRCGKTETQEIRPKEGGGLVPTSEIVVNFQGQTISYEDLCTRCRGACEGYFKSITKQIEKSKEREVTAKKTGLLGLGGRKTG